MGEFDHVGVDTLPPDGYLQPRRFRICYRCLRCGHEYSRVTTKLDKRDPPCPRVQCRAEAIAEQRAAADENLRTMLEEQQPPAQVGHRTIVRAIDATAKIAMEDYGLTDLKDNIREGETMAPKLPPDKQRAADSFFSGAEVARQVGPRAQRRINALGQRAIAGAFRNMAVDPARVMPGNSGEQVLRMVRKENYK